MGGQDSSRDKDNPLQSPNKPYQGKAEDMKLWGILIFGIIGATATTFAVSFYFSSLLFFFFNSNWLLNVCIYGKILLFIVWCYLNSYWQSQSEREWLKLELYVLQWLCWYWVFGMWLYFAYTPTCISFPRPKIPCSGFS